MITAEHRQRQDTAEHRQRQETAEHRQRQDPESIAIAWGYKGRVSGVKGSFLVLADWEGDESEYWKPDTWKLKGAKMVRVDGEHIKENTWYTMRNGKIVEVTEDYR